MIVCNNVPKGYDKPVLTVVVFHHIRGAGDSCPTNTEYKSINTIESLRPGQHLFQGREEWAKVEIVSINEREIEVLWRNKKKAVVKFGDMAVFGMEPDEETVWCEEYYKIKLFYDSDSSNKTIWKKYNEVLEKHRQLGEQGIIKHGQDEDQVITSIEELHSVYGGKKEYSHAVEVLKKLLLTANNWWTFKMTDDDLDRTGLKYELCNFYGPHSSHHDDNYLSIDDELGWRVISWMFKNNDPTRFITSRNTFADLLAKAAAAANKYATTVFGKYANSLKSNSITDYAYLMIAYKSWVVDCSDYPLIEKTLIRDLPAEPAYDVSEPERPDLNGNVERIMERIYEITELSKVNNDTGKQWRTVPLVKEAFEYMQALPDVLPGHFATPADKANLCFDLANYVNAPDAPHFSLQAREYVASLYGQCINDICAARLFDNPESTEAKAFQATKDNFENNKAYLQKRHDYLDENIPISEFCKKYNIAYLYDAIELTEDWELHNYAVLEEVEQRLSPYSLDEQDQYTFSMLEQARVLQKYGMEWQDTLQVNHEQKFWYFAFNIQGEDYYANDIYHYGLLSAIAQLEQCDAEDYLYHLATAYANMAYWINSDGYLDNEALKTIIDKFRQNIVGLEKQDTLDETDIDFAFETLEEIQEIAGEAKNIRYDAEHPNPAKILEEEWNELCLEIERLCAEGLSRANPHVREMMDKAEKQCRELIDTHNNNGLYLHLAFHLCCDDWDKHIVVRHEEFRNAVSRAIKEHGCLSPNSHRDWLVIEQLLVDNPTDHIIPDFKQMSDLIEKALAEGDDNVKEWVTTIKQKMEEHLHANPSKQQPEDKEKSRQLSPAEIEKHDEILNRCMQMINEIAAIHRENPSIVNDTTTDKEKEVLEGFNCLINDFGRTNLIVYRAALEACNSWYTFVLSRPTCFKTDVEKAIAEHGALSPDSTIDWRIMYLLSANNDINNLFNDLGQLRHLLQKAVRDGNGKVKSYAVDLLNKGSQTMSFGRLTASDDNKNVVPNGYTYKIGARHVTVYNEKLASPYYDIHCLEARGSQSGFVETIESAIHGMAAVGKKYDLMENDTLLTCLNTLIAAHRLVESDESKINEARNSVYAISGEFQKYADIINGIDRYKAVAEADSRTQLACAMATKASRMQEESGKHTTKEIEAMKTDTLERFREVIYDWNCDEYYLWYAALLCCDDWNTYLLVRPDEFRDMMQRAVKRNCLHPKEQLNWRVLDMLSDNNDPDTFMDDKDKYYDLLATAMEEGNRDVCNIARKIMNMIWEPENCQEED